MSHNTVVNAILKCHLKQTFLEDAFSQTVRWDTYLLQQCWNKPATFCLNAAHVKQNWKTQLHLKLYFYSRITKATINIVLQTSFLNRIYVGKRQWNVDQLINVFNHGSAPAAQIPRPQATTPCWRTSFVFICLKILLFKLAGVTFCVTG